MTARRLAPRPTFFSSPVVAWAPGPCSPARPFVPKLQLPLVPKLQLGNIAYPGSQLANVGSQAGAWEPEGKRCWVKDSAYVASGEPCRGPRGENDEDPELAPEDPATLEHIEPLAIVGYPFSSD